MSAPMWWALVVVVGLAAGMLGYRRGYKAATDDLISELDRTFPRPPNGH